DGAVAKFVSQVAPGKLGEHVAREKQAAHQSAQGVGLTARPQKGDLVFNHPGDDRPRNRSVRRAHDPAQQQPSPERVVLLPAPRSCCLHLRHPFCGYSEKISNITSFSAIRLPSLSWNRCLGNSRSKGGRALRWIKPVTSSP